MRRENKQDFVARIICRADVIEELDVWVPEFIPHELEKRSSTEWIRDHIMNIFGGDTNRLREAIFGKIDSTENFQILVTDAEIRGWFSGLEEEYDEEITWTKAEIRPLPDDFFDSVTTTSP
jgi:hypothetical protein